MAKKTIIDAITKLYSKLGGNLSDVLGTRSNVNFMGTGKSSEPFLDMDLNIEALGALSQSKAVNELKSAVGFATADKLNDLQANKLLTNMMKMDEFYNPQPVTNITDMATGTRDLDAQGLESLRTKVLPDEEKSALMSRLDEIVAKKKEASSLTSQEIADKNIIEQMYRTAGPRNLEDDAGYLAEFIAEDAGKVLDDLPIAEQNKFIERAKNSLRANVSKYKNATPFDEAVEYNARPEDVVQNLVDQKFGVGYFDNVGSTPAQRGSAREFLLEALKKENPNQTNFSDIIEEIDVKYITEGGGGQAGDPLTLVNKYFGPRIAEMVPSGASSEEIAIFTERVLNNVVDANGLRPGDPRFDRLTAKFTEDFADGGIAGLETRQGLRFGGKAAKNILAKINKKMIQDAADDIFPTGDYKYDAEMVVESLVENNPKLFKNLLADDLDDALRSELYGLAVNETGSRLSKSIKAKRAGNVVDTNITEKVTPKGFSLNVEKAVSELNIPREEAVRISQLPSDQQKLELQKYLDKDFSQRIALTDYKPNKFDAAKGGLAKILEV